MANNILSDQWVCVRLKIKTFAKLSLVTKKTQGFKYPHRNNGNLSLGGKIKLKFQTVLNQLNDFDCNIKRFFVFQWKITLLPSPISTLIYSVCARNRLNIVTESNRSIFIGHTDTREDRTKYKKWCAAAIRVHFNSNICTIPVNVKANGKYARFDEHSMCIVQSISLEFQEWNLFQFVDEKWWRDCFDFQNLNYFLFTLEMDATELEQWTEIMLNSEKNACLTWKSQRILFCASNKNH